MKSLTIPQIPKEEYEEIKKAITPSESFDPVQTHIIIIHKLTDIQKRLEKLESLKG